MSQITLTPPMRSNLLSLQQISKLQDKTQLRLASGLKVNSAIDNPSSYYTAQSLSSRANDLSALLDAMGQGVQTIKVATEGIEKAEDLLKQMKAVAEQTESPRVPEKEYFENQVGANGAVVTTSEELRNAVDSGKETICVYGNIDLGDISISGGLQLKENQKLVGVGYYGDYSNGEGFSSLSATASVANKNLIDITKSGNYLISDLSLNYENTATNGSSFAINASGKNVVADLQNLNIVAKFSELNNSGKSAIAIQGKASGNINNKINVNINSTNGCGINTYNAYINIKKYATINISTLGTRGYGINIHTNSSLDIESEATIHINTEGSYGFGIIAENSSIANIQDDAVININTSGREGHGICSYSSSLVNVSSTVKIKTSGNAGYGFHVYEKSNINIFSNSYIDLETSGWGIQVYSNSNINIAGNIAIHNENCISANSVSGNKISITSSANLYLIGKNNLQILNGYNNGHGPNTLEIASGAKLAFEKDGQAKWYEVQENYRDENNSKDENKISIDNVTTILNVSETSSWQTAKDIVTEKLEEQKNAQAQEDAQKQADFAAAEEKFIANQNLYNSTLTQYDSLISDSWYKGTNLLQGDSLKINFNEDRSSNLLVKGEDISSSKIGLATAAWENTQDVQNSLTQILSAQNKLRETSTKLGNYYLITTERSNFTDKLIQVLEEGADKLTLADMNEESANMLALQTRQSLATNSLSLASQASQSILKLF